MRPSILDPLFVPLTSLAGIGQKTASLIARVVGRDVDEEVRSVDLLLLPPHRLIDRCNQPGVAFAPKNSIVTLKTASRSASAVAARAPQRALPGSGP